MPKYTTEANIDLDKLHLYPQWVQDLAHQQPAKPIQRRSPLIKAYKILPKHFGAYAWVIAATSANRAVALAMKFSKLEGHPVPAKRGRDFFHCVRDPRFDGFIDIEWAMEQGERDLICFLDPSSGEAIQGPGGYLDDDDNTMWSVSLVEGEAAAIDSLPVTSVKSQVDG